ncbi:hypothetical protein JI435_421670, partial [Parastagonospora nodorum SN15]
PSTARPMQMWVTGVTVGCYKMRQGIGSRRAPPVSAYTFVSSDILDLSSSFSWGFIAPRSLAFFVSLFSHPFLSLIPFPHLLTTT